MDELEKEPVGLLRADESVDRKKTHRLRRRTLGLVSALAVSAGSVGVAKAIEPSESPKRSGASSAVSSDLALHNSLSFVSDINIGPRSSNYQPLPPDPEVQKREFIFTVMVARAKEWEAQAAAANADGKYDRLANCETQGNWQMHGSRYSGGVGFSNDAWSDWRLDGMPYNAGDATKVEQIVVAERIRYEIPPSGSFGHGKWGCAGAVGLP